MNNLSQIFATLDDEAEALIAGDYTYLAELGAARMNAVEALDHTTLTVQELEELSLRMQTLQDMTYAALTGLRSAAVRVAMGHAAREHLASYGPDGAARSIAAPKADLSRRA